MEDDSRVSKLAELIFDRKIAGLSEMTCAHSILPACMFKRIFSQSLLIVLKNKYIIVRNQYLNFIDKCYYKMFRSHETYLTYLMYACQAENTRNMKVFDSFVGICSLLMFLSDETTSKTEMDFSNLNLDIFMVFYRDVMHKLFRKAGGLKKFAKYILNHEYLKDFDNVLTVCMNNCPVKICLEDMLHEFTFELDAIEKDDISVFLAKKVLLKTSVELPPLISMRELVTKRIASCRIEMAKRDEQKTGIENVLDTKLCRKDVEKCFNPNREAKITQETAQRVNDALKKFCQAFAEQKEDNTQKENFVQGFKTSNTDSETDLGSELKEDNTQNKNFAQAVMTSNSDSETNLTAEQIEDNAEKGNSVQGVKTSNTDSETDLVSEQKEDNAQKKNFVQVVKTLISDSETNLRSTQKEDNAQKENFVQGVKRLNSDPETNLASEQKEFNIEKEGIVQEVMRYNHLDKAGAPNNNRNILKRAYDILEHLKLSVQTVSKILDESDEE